VEAIAQALHESSTQVFNTTDPDCRHMPSRQGTHAAYNVQAAVDDQHGLVVNTDVVNDVNDRHQLAPQVEQSNAGVGRPYKTVCADAGYDHNASWKCLEERQTAVVVKPNAQEPPGPFTKDKFRYDATLDCYVCPLGQILAYRHRIASTQHRVYRAAAKVCRACPQRALCTRNGQGRSIRRQPFEEIRSVVEGRYASSLGQALYARRQGRVEHPFGHIKRNLGVQAFLMRGLAGARAEASILASCFNLARMMSLWGSQTLIGQLRTA
jgi:hypothetical protein